LRVPAVRTPTFPVGHEVRVRNWLAELLRAVRPGAPHLRPGPHLRHGARGDSLPSLRRAPWPRVSRRTAADGPAVLHEPCIADVCSRRRRAAALGVALAVLADSVQSAGSLQATY